MNDQQRAAMQMALESLEACWDWDGERHSPRTYPSHVTEAINALREALAQPQGEWVDLTDDDFIKLPAFDYEAPQFLAEKKFVEAVIAKFKEKNAPPVVPQGEPVAWRDHVEDRIRTWKQRTMNRSGDFLSIDDFMGADSIDDLIDFVCDEWSDPVCATPPAVEAAIEATKEKIEAMAIEWGNARQDDHGGHALRNFAAAIRSMK